MAYSMSQELDLAQLIKVQQAYRLMAVAQSFLEGVELSNFSRRADYVMGFSDRLMIGKPLVPKAGDPPVLFEQMAAQYRAHRQAYLDAIAQETEVRKKHAPIWLRHSRP